MPEPLNKGYFHFSPIKIHQHYFKLTNPKDSMYPRLARIYNPAER